VALIKIELHLNDSIDKTVSPLFLIYLRKFVYIAPPNNYL